MHSLRGNMIPLRGDLSAIDAQSNRINLVWSHTGRCSNFRRAQAMTLQTEEQYSISARRIAGRRSPQVVHFLVLRLAFRGRIEARSKG